MAGSTAGRIAEPKSGDAGLIFTGLGLLVAVVGGAWAALSLAGGQDVPGNPIAALALLARGKLVWPVAATVWAVGFALIIAVVLVGVGWWWMAVRQPRSRVDGAARHLASTRDVESITAKAVAQKATDLKVMRLDPKQCPYCTVGVPIGKLVGGPDVFGSCEDMHLDIWGPRMGKSTSRIITAICEAPGPLLSTENKPGNYQHTRLIREFRRYDDPDHPEGVPRRAVWLFDPQRVANGEPTFYWNPLTYIIDHRRTTPEPAPVVVDEAVDDGTGFEDITSFDFLKDDDELAAGATATTSLIGADPEDRAKSLAEQFSSSGDGQQAKKDPYFDPEGEDLLANLLLASALAGEQITMVYARLSKRRNCAQAVKILTEHDYPLVAAALETRLNLEPKQADGIFGTALKMAECLRAKRLKPWITTFDGDTRPELDLYQYVAGGESLYCLSREGVGSAGPIVAAMTVAACEAAEVIATASPFGRLPIPMLCALDEAANVVRWKRLPDLYSHYGSRGINIMTVLQSWSQGVRVWGVDGMKQLMGAANVMVYGGNVKEDDFLELLSKLAGDYDRQSVSVSRSRGVETRSTQITRERIFTVGDLQKWPRGRALVFSAGNPAAIVKTIPWQKKPYADDVRRSLETYGEKENSTLITRLLGGVNALWDRGAQSTDPAPVDEALDPVPADADPMALAVTR